MVSPSHNSAAVKSTHRYSQRYSTRMLDDASPPHLQSTAVLRHRQRPRPHSAVAVSVARLLLCRVHTRTNGVLVAVVVSCFDCSPPTWRLVADETNLRHTLARERIGQLRPALRCCNHPCSAQRALCCVCSLSPSIHRVCPVESILGRSRYSRCTRRAGFRCVSQPSSPRFC